MPSRPSVLLPERARTRRLPARRRALALIVALVLCVVAACGSDGADDRSLRSDASTTTATTALADGRGGTTSTTEGESKAGLITGHGTTMPGIPGSTGTTGGPGTTVLPGGPFTPTSPNGPTTIGPAPPTNHPNGPTTTQRPNHPTSTTPEGCITGRPLSNTTTVSTGGAAAGQAVDPDGVGLMIGHSNGVRIFPPFITRSAAVSDFDWVMASQGGKDSASWAVPGGARETALYLLEAAGWTPADVQVVVGVLSRKAPDPTATDVIDQYRDVDLPRIMAWLEATFPNLRLVYIEPRESGRFSYANGEPSAYRFNVAALEFANSYHGRATVLLGPYLWDDGLCTRSDGLSTVRSDFEGDGLHPNPTGAAKYADAMVRYFQTHPSSAPWF